LKGDRHLAHASLSLKLDDELGTHHGLSLADFIALRQISQAQSGCLPVIDLVRPMGLRLSAVMRMLLPLEKTGLLQRESAMGSDERCVAIRPAGRRVLREALLTAEEVCNGAVAQLPADALPLVESVLTTLCRADSLAV
jgi:DNA-binding MarR family transcriptional regulator